MLLARGHALAVCNLLAPLRSTSSSKRAPRHATIIILLLYYYLIIIFLSYTHQHKVMHHHFHIKEISSNKSTLLRTAIFTFGHYWIDVLSNHFITGASISSAMVASVAGPILNAIWYYILDRMFFNYILSKHK